MATDYHKLHSRLDYGTATIRTRSCILGVYECAKEAGEVLLD